MKRNRKRKEKRNQKNGKRKHRWLGVVKWASPILATKEIFGLAHFTTPAVVNHSLCLKKSLLWAQRRAPAPAMSPTSAASRACGALRSLVEVRQRHSKGLHMRIRRRGVLVRRPEQGLVAAPQRPRAPSVGADRRRVEWFWFVFSRRLHPPTFSACSEASSFREFLVFALKPSILTPPFRALVIRV